MSSRSSWMLSASYSKSLTTSPPTVDMLGGAASAITIHTVSKDKSAQPLFSSPWLPEAPETHDHDAYPT